MLLLAVFGTLLYRVTGQDDILLGGPFANRSRPEFERLIGYFANTLVVRLKFAGNPEFRTLLSRAREATLEVLDHQEVSFETIVEAVRPPRDAAANPLFQVNFRVRVDAAPTLELAGTTTRRIPLDIGLARFDLALELHVHQDGVLAQFNYDTALFDARTVERLAEDFVGLLRQALAEPDTRLLDFHVSGDSAAVSVATGPESIRRFRATRTAASDPDPVG
jgi:non-ribosomal peptide synthetase component F